MLVKNYYNVLNKIKDLSSNINSSVKLIAVSKTFPETDIRELYDLGQRDFAENYVQEFSVKAQSLKDLDISWHFIGNIQSNKIKQISQYSSWVHSLSSMKHAILLNKNRSIGANKLNVLIEVNISEENNKHGLKNITQIIELANIINSQENLIFRGLMGMASATEDITIIYNQFSLLKKTYNEIILLGYQIDTLSMGMSGDYNIAIKNGATMVRIGSLIFGKRQ